MQIKCIAVDDEPLALEVIKQYVSRSPALKLAHTFDDAIYAAEYLNANSIDLLFLDINMPDITGLELLKSLKEKPMVIFTTAHRKFAVEGFENDAIDYLLKPIEFERFSKAVNKALDFYQYKTSSKPLAGEAIFVNSDYQKLKIELAEIEYIESLEDYLKIHRVDKKPVMTLVTLKAMIEKLPAEKFIRIHRSYVVATSKIQAVLNRKVRLPSTELPISASYVDAVNEWLMR